MFFSSSVEEERWAQLTDPTCQSVRSQVEVEARLKQALYHAKRIRTFGRCDRCTAAHDGGLMRDCGMREVDAKGDYRHKQR